MTLFFIYELYVARLRRPGVLSLLLSSKLIRNGLKSKYHGVLESFVKNDEIRPSISCQIILE